MREYENLVIFDVQGGEENIDKKIEEVKEMIVKKGKLLNVDKWGQRQLAYPVNKKERGYYVLFEFDSDRELLPSLDRQLKLSKNVLRHCIVRKPKK